jgi:Uncharacterized alpha/beta hydrolase domain (DUF2235)
MRKYEPGDRIYLFGFSRGAYTARVLAGMIHKIGSLSQADDALMLANGRERSFSRFAESPVPTISRVVRATFIAAFVGGVLPRINTELERRTSGNAPEVTQSRF